MSVDVIVWAGVFAGCIARTLLPYLRKLKDDPSLKFDRRYLVTFAGSVVESAVASLLLIHGVPSELLSLPVSKFGLFASVASWAYVSNDVLNRYVT